MKYSVLNLDSLANNKNYCPLKRNVKGGLTAVSYACKLNDSIIFFNSSSPWQYSFMNIYSDKRENFNNFPVVVSHPQLTDFIANTNIYTANYSVRTGDYSQLCVAYWYFPVIDIVSLKDRHVLRLIFPFDKHSYKLKMVDPLNAVLEGRHNFYKDIYTTENSIYLLYRNYSNKFEFHQFTWDGTLKQRYVVDEYIKTFCVDEVSGKIYAVKRGDNYEPELIVYNF